MLQNSEQSSLTLIRELENWKLYATQKNSYVVKFLNKITHTFYTKPEAEKFMLYSFFRHLDLLQGKASANGNCPNTFQNK